MDAAAWPQGAVAAARAAVDEGRLDAIRRFVDGFGIVRDDAGQAHVGRLRSEPSGGLLLWFAGLRRPLHLVVGVEATADGAWQPRFAISAPHADVALRIRSAALEPDAITAALGIAPSRQARAGRTLDGGAADRDFHLWLRDLLPGDPAPADEKIAALLDLLAPQQRALADLLRGSSAACVTVAWHADAERMDGLRFAPALLARLAGLGLALELDLHAERPGPPTS